MSSLTPTQSILIVEDSDDDYETTLRAFKKTSNLANPIYRCEDGQEALDFLLHEGEFANGADAPRPGIILLDLNLPGKDGRKVLQVIKDNPDLAKIPVVVLTTSDDERDIANCYGYGANTFIRKPVDLDNFVEAIKRMKDYWFGIAILPRNSDLTS